MKYTTILKTLFVPILTGCLFAACKKGEDIIELGDKGNRTVRFALTPNSGSFLTKSYIPDASVAEEIISLLDFQPKLEGSVTAPSDLTLEYKLDVSAIEKYNAQQAADPDFDPFYLLPDSTYSIVNKNDVIKQGDVYASGTGDNIIIYTHKINATVNYILPITVTNPNFSTAIGSGTILFYLIGNPISGNYTWDYTRYNGDTTIAPNSSSFTGETTAPVPTGPTSLILPEDYLTSFVAGSKGLILSFKDMNGVLSDFTVSFDAATKKGLADGGFTIAQEPLLLSYQIVGDASTQYKGSTFRTYYSLINSSGGTRTLVDKYVKQ